MRTELRLMLAGLLMIGGAATAGTQQSNGYVCANYHTGSCQSLTGCNQVTPGTCANGNAYDRILQGPLTFGSCYTTTNNYCNTSGQVKSCATIKFYGGSCTGNSACTVYTFDPGC
jgi:hypothetical protein